MATTSCIARRSEAHDLFDLAQVTHVVLLEDDLDVLRLQSFFEEEGTCVGAARERSVSTVRRLGAFAAHGWRDNLLLVWRGARQRPSAVMLAHAELDLDWYLTRA